MIFLALQARAILLVFEKFSSVYLLQIALKIIWFPTQNTYYFSIYYTSCF